MTRDVAAVGLISVAFAAWLTAHAMLLLGLLRRSPRWRAPVALLVPLAAPYWGWRSGMRTRTALWLVSAVAYAVAVVRAGR
jgi:hypothetical protein